MGAIVCDTCGGSGNTHAVDCFEAKWNRNETAVLMEAQATICRSCSMPYPVHQASCAGSVGTNEKPAQIPWPETAEVRTTSSTGGQKGVKPQRLSLLPHPALAKISEVYGFGEKKYAAHNWRKGYEWDKSYDAIQRHLGAWNDGEDNDPESGLSHLAHAAFHILTLLTFVLNPKYKQFDTRHSTVQEK